MQVLLHFPPFRSRSRSCCAGQHVPLLRQRRRVIGSGAPLHNKPCVTDCNSTVVLYHGRPAPRCFLPALLPAVRACVRHKHPLCHPPPRPSPALPPPAPPPALLQAAACRIYFALAAEQAATFTTASQPKNTARKERAASEGCEAASPVCHASPASSCSRRPLHSSFGSATQLESGALSQESLAAPKAQNDARLGFSFL